jgi:plastocyanin
VVLIPALAMLVALAQVPATEQRRPGAIRGVVDVRLDLPPLAQRPSVAELGASARPDTPDRRRSVVYLETAPQGAFEDHDRPHASLDQKNEAFFPYVLAISVGTTVDFPNRDRTYHNVFSLSKPQRFDLGRYAAGQSKSVRFDRPGVVRVFCDIHSHMSAFILVFAHRFFAITDEAGAYRIDNVPPGTYNLVVWTDGRIRQTLPVRVPEEGGVVTQDFVVE